ncbi:hypothetical protein CPB84DRAFT_1777647 [Gymnopilus junonius]|uniref:Uncharacterized protein n=1 Tax=Gymnopilus junonius TaxID=109634 RepID=A0A9P5TNP7_GYMJU|nr:hypothetical protein CPB84DRAFT_1777647 [Gymnopilus junonius]
MANVEFDRQFKLVTSYLFSPTTLAAIRLLVAFYTLFVLVFLLVWEGVKDSGVQSFFSYFTNLTYVGICAYFWASGVQTLVYAQNLKSGKKAYLLQGWPRAFRYLHVRLLTTVITYPILVTIVYWALLSDPSTLASVYSSWSNISKHALNSVFALFEIICTDVPTMPWLDLLITIVILGGYLGIAYITHATQGFYTYEFLDPQKEGKILAAYIVGIAVGQVVVFLLVQGALSLRQRYTANKAMREAEPEKLYWGSGKVTESGSV